MTAKRRLMAPSERRAGIAFLAAAALAAGAWLQPLGAEGDAGEGAAPIRLSLLDASGRTGDFLHGPPFDPQRRPLAGLGTLDPPPAPMPVPDAVSDEPPLRLSGILDDGERRRALFQGFDGWQRVGDSVRGWRITALEPRRVTLRRDGDTLVLDASDAFRP